MKVIDMPWVPRPKEVESVTRLDGGKRYDYLVKKVADEELIWSLWNDGWALAADDDGTTLIPVWPHATYAQLCATGEWSAYNPKSIELDAFVARWIPGASKDGRSFAVFPTSKNRGTVAQPDRFGGDIEAALSEYG